MLRITKERVSPSEVTLKLEGKVISEWVRLLEREIRGLLEKGKIVNVDCSGVKYIDDHAVQLLKTSCDGKVRIVNATALVHDLMEIRD